MRNGAALPNATSECGRQFGMWLARRGLSQADPSSKDAYWEIWQEAWALGAWAGLRDNGDLGLLTMQMQEKLDALTALIHRMQRPEEEAE